MSLFISFSVALVLVRLRQQFINNFVFPLGPVLLVLIITSNHNACSASYNCAFHVLLLIIVCCMPCIS